MTNEEKFKTTEERDEAFAMFCSRGCYGCPLYHYERSCQFAWLNLEAPMAAEEVADMLAKYVTWRKDGHGQTSPYTWEEANTAIDRAVELLREKNKERG